MFTFKRFFALTFALSASFANATLSSADLTPGDGALTIDSQSQLLWLDLPLTYGQSFDQVRIGKWMADGFRYATLDEVRTLFADAGVSFSYAPPQDPQALQMSSGSGESAQQLGALLGINIPIKPEANITIPLVSPIDTNKPLNGLIGTDSQGVAIDSQNHPVGTSFQVTELSMAAVQLTSLPDLSIASISGRQVQSSASALNVGSFLVKSAVPEVQTSLQLLIGLIGLALLRPKKNRH